MPDIQILQTDPVTGVLSLGMGRSPKVLTGIQLLAQVVALTIFKNPGRDVLAPYEGSGLRALIGQYSLGNADEIRLLLIQKIGQVEKDIIAKQAAGGGSPTEKLKKLSIQDVAVDSVAGKVIARIKIINEAGGTTDILV